MYYAARRTSKVFSLHKIPLKGIRSMEELLKISCPLKSSIRSYFLWKLFIEQIQKILLHRRALKGLLSQKSFKTSYSTEELLKDFFHKGTLRDPFLSRSSVYGRALNEFLSIEQLDKVLYLYGSYSQKSFKGLLPQKSFKRPSSTEEV